jgi:nicotinate phosphoribosyltransferase
LPDRLTLRPYDVTTMSTINKEIQMNPIITRMDDEDLYKLSMLRVVRENYPDAVAKSRFIVRGDQKLGCLKDEVRSQIDSWGDLRVLPETIEHLHRACPYLGEEFLDWYAGYRMNPKLATVEEHDGQLMIECDGLWQDIMGFECKDLATVSELHTKMVYGLGDEDAWALAEPILRQKIANFKEYPRLLLAEFGFRRRATKYVQDRAVGLLKAALANPDHNQLVGTSNVWMAQKHDITPIGTMAHEMIQAHLVLAPTMRLAQKNALYTWLQTYDDNLGIALSDTFTSAAFFRDFGKILSEAYKGLRHDSGSPDEFGFKAIRHYKSHDINPLDKSIAFTDGLDDHEAIRIWKVFVGLINVSFGIGTKITNDLGPKYPALKIVQKLVELNGKHVVKLSDDAGKNAGDQATVKEVEKIYSA